MAEITKFDGKDLEKRVTDTIQATFGMLIPDDVWESKVQAEILAFFEEDIEFSWSECYKKEGYSSSSKVQVLSTKITPFRQMEWAILQQMAEKRLNEAMCDPDFNVVSSWDSGTIKYSISEMLNTKLDELAPKMAKELFRDMFGSAVVSVKQAVVNDLKGHL
jgi:hypothetical protein